MPTSAAPAPTVFVVDDDPSALSAACYLVESFGLRAVGFSSATKFLESFDASRPGCLLLDVRMPDLTGLELQQELINRGSRLPIIMLSGHGDVASCAQAFRAGAFDFLEKPVSDELLLRRLREAIAKDAHLRSARAANPDFFARLGQLTPREREVMELLVQGKSLKQIGIEFGISIQTASKHRLRLFEKLGVRSDVELVKILLKNPGHEQERAATGAVG